MLAQLLGLPDAVDPDHTGETTGPPCRHAGERVLEDRRLPWGDAQRMSGRQEGVRGGFSLQVFALGEHTVDALLEQILDPRGYEYLATVTARRDHRPVKARVPHRANVAHGALIGLHALFADHAQHNPVLAVAQPRDGLRGHRIALLALREVDAARSEERPHTVITWLAVDVLVVVGGAIERLEGQPVALGPVVQEVVEHFLPRLRVNLGGLREDAVEVEQARRDPSGDKRHVQRVPRR